VHLSVPRAIALRRERNRRRPRSLAFIVGASMVGVLVFVAVFAGVLAPHDPNAQELTNRLQMPSSEYPLGTDYLGRDILSRVLYGTRVALFVSAISVGIAVVFGTAVGLLSGYFGGRTDLYLMRVTDGLLAFPGIVLALAVVSGLGRGLTNAAIALGIVFAPQFARLVRAEALRVRELEYVAAARLTGKHPLSVIVRHVLPNTAFAIIIQAAAFVGFAVLAESGLSFLGLGAVPPTPSWGAMLQYGYSYLEVLPWGVFAPSCALLFTVLAFLLLGEGLRDRLDPRRERVSR
jgi:peptide/nickel transport system permease protein